MDFSKKGVEKKQKALVSKLPRNKKKLTVSLFKAMLVLFLAIIVLGIGAGFGALKGILDDTPEVNAKDLIPKGYRQPCTIRTARNSKFLQASMQIANMSTMMIFRKIWSMHLSLLKINVSGNITVSTFRVSCVHLPMVFSQVTSIRVQVH